MPSRVPAAVGRFRARPVVLLAGALLAPVLVAAGVIGVLVPRAATESAVRAASRDVGGLGVALAVRCEAIGAVAVATAREVAAYGARYPSVPQSAAQVAADRAVARRPLAAVAVLDADSTPLAVAGPVTGRAAALAADGRSCGRTVAGPVAGGAVAGGGEGFGDLGAGLAEQVPVMARGGVRIATVSIWSPVDRAALQALRTELGTESSLAALAVLVPGRASTPSESGTAEPRTRASGTAPRVLAAAGPDAGPGGGLAEIVAGLPGVPTSGTLTGSAGRRGYAVRPPGPGVPFAVLAVSPEPAGGPLWWPAGAVLGAGLLALLAAGWIDRRRTDPLTGRLQDAAGELQRSREELLATVDRLSETLGRTHDLDGLLETLCHACRPAAGAVAAVAVLPDSAVLPRVRILLPGPDAERAAAVLPGFAAECVRAASDGLLVRDLPDAGPALGVPLLAGGEGIGLLALARGAGAEGFGHAELTRMRLLAEHAGTAIANVRAHEEARRLSVTDPLTGVGNVRQLSTTLSREVERATRFDRPLTVLMLDLDHFKQVNDSFGHAFGDLVLREFAARLSGCLREVDTVARAGGEEFAVVLPETEPEGGLRVAERVLAAVRAEPFGDGETRRAVTVSVGIAGFPQHGRSAGEVLRAADAALYLAKRAGRDGWAMPGRSAAAPSVPQAG